VLHNLFNLFASVGTANEQQYFR